MTAVGREKKDLGVQQHGIKGWADWVLGEGKRMKWRGTNAI